MINLVATDDVDATEAAIDKLANKITQESKQLNAMLGCYETRIDLGVALGQSSSTLNSLLSRISGVFAPAVHALHSSRFTIVLPVSTPLTDLPDDIMELDHEFALCLEVEASKGTTEPTLLHPQPSENDDSDEVFRQQLMDGLTFTSEDRAVVEEVTRGQNTNIEWFKQRMGGITSTQTEDIRKFSAPDSRISAERLVTTCLSKRCQHMKNVTRPNQRALR